LRTFDGLLLVSILWDAGFKVTSDVIPINLALVYHLQFFLSRASDCVNCNVVCPLQIDSYRHLIVSMLLRYALITTTFIAHLIVSSYPPRP
jgi:hypothetical protein